MVPATSRLRRACPVRPSRRGQTLVEYALIIAVIATVAIGVLVTLGQQTKTLFSAVTSQVSRGTASS